MAMNQKQRDYFIDRVKELTKSHINQLKAKYASEIQTLADEKYKEFLEGVGVYSDMDSLKTAESVQSSIHERMFGVVEGMKEVYSSAMTDYPNYYTSCNYYDRYNTYFKACCRAIAKEEFAKTEGGQELESLENTQREAIDTIMMDGSKVSELTMKLNKILGNSGIELLSGGAKA